MDYNASIAPMGKDGAVVDMDDFFVPNHTCNPLRIPSFHEYLKAFDELAYALFSLGGLALVIVFILYADTLRHIFKSAPTAAKSHSAFILSVYPVVAIATYITTIVPRAQLLSEAVTQAIFMLGLYQLFCLIVAYSGGEAQLIKKVRPNHLSLQVAPCCCWPCCSLLPTFPVTKKCLLVLRLLVLQLPVAQCLIYLAHLVIWAENQALYHSIYNYTQPFVIGSILTGIWATIMTLKATALPLKNYHMQGKFIVLQLVLLFAKFQGALAKFMATSNLIPCTEPITPTVYAHLIYNSALLWEMVLLCSVARYLYKKSLPEFYTTDSNSNIPKHIGTISDKSLKSDGKNDTLTIIKF